MSNIKPETVDHKALKKEKKWLVQVGVSRTHVHLSQEHMETLFGEGYQLTILRNLKQNGQFFAKETVNVITLKGVLQKVRIIGPARAYTQIELRRVDTNTLGIDAPIRDSGNIDGTPGGMLMGPAGLVSVENGCIIPRAHIHMLDKKAEKLELNDGDKVSILIRGEKTICFYDVKVRIIHEGLTEFHIDTDEANAAFVETGDVALIKHKEIVIKDNFGNIIEVETDNIKFILAKGPYDYYSLEGIRLLRTVFDYPTTVQKEIVQKMLNPQSIDPNKYYLFTAVEQDKVFGIACFYWMPRINMAYIEHIGITPDYQGRGLGSFFFNKVISFLEKNHPEIEGALLEVRQNREDLDNRKEFFLCLGAIPIDTGFYPSGLKLGQETMLMFKPVTNEARLTDFDLELTLRTLSKIL